ncbi:DUF4097 family beta strand repeat-containing protein [Actinoplanes sp. NPDC049598]
MYEFEHPTPVVVALRAINGTVDLVAESRDSVQVDVEPYDDKNQEEADRTRVVLDGDNLLIEAPGADSGWRLRRFPKLRITARVPLGSGLTGRSTSADVRAEGVWSLVRLDLASADVSVDEVTGDAALTAASGDLHVRRVGGSLKAESSSGDLRIGDVTGDVSAKTASGDIRIDSLGGSIRSSVASGDIEIGRMVNGAGDIRSASGDVSVGIAAGTRVWLDLSSASGRTTSDLRPEAAESAPTGPGHGAGPGGVGLGAFVDLDNLPGLNAVPGLKAMLQSVRVPDFGDYGPGRGFHPGPDFRPGPGPDFRPGPGPGFNPGPGFHSGPDAASARDAGPAPTSEAEPEPVPDDVLPPEAGGPGSIELRVRTASGDIHIHRATTERKAV